MSAFVVGIGSSGLCAEDNIRRALGELCDHPLWRVVGRSGLKQNPAVGGATVARFVNAAVVVDTALHPGALLSALFAIEARLGRVRGEKNGPRPCDLDVLWASSVDARTPGPPVLPHPRLWERAFALVPALEALRDAGMDAPLSLQQAAQRLSVATLVDVSLR